MDDVDPQLIEAYFAFMESSRLLEDLVDHQLRADGNISYPQFVLLIRLAEAEEGRLRMTELARTAVHSPSGLTYQARALEQAGFVTRQPSKSDGRSIEITITDAGRTVLQQVLPAHVHLVHEAMTSPLNTMQLNNFAEAVLLLRENLRS